MNRRDFLMVTATITLAAPLMVPSAGAAEEVAYTPGLVEARLAKGETVFLDFKASWCSTCAAQARVMDALKAENPAYDKGITFITVDWDQYKDDALTQRLQIPRRSTLVVLKGEEELGRIVAGTAKAEIKALMDTGLAAES